MECIPASGNTNTELFMLQGAPESSKTGLVGHPDGAGTRS